MNTDMFGQLQRAMAYRAKYRLYPNDPKRKLSCEIMAVHMMNRGLHDIYPNGADVRELGIRLYMSTLDLAEANHNGVVVEEVPAHERTAIKFKDPVTGQKYLSIGDYKLAKCCGNNRLATCFSETSARHVGFGTLSFIPMCF